MLDREILDLMPKRIQVTTSEDEADSSANILLDDALAREVGKGIRPPTVRVWRHTAVRGLVVSKRDAAGEAGERAVQLMADEGCPIIVRHTGGTAVPHGEGVLNLSFLLPRQTQQVSTDSYYQLLCQPLLDWLRGMGLTEVATGALPGSYCDGNYNVLVDGQKLVGTAQAWRGGLAGTASKHPGYVLAHACIVIDVDFAWATAAINRFYSEIGDPYRVEEATSTSLLALLRRHRLATDYDARCAQRDLVRFLQRYYTEQGIQVDLS